MKYQMADKVAHLDRTAILDASTRGAQDTVLTYLAVPDMHCGGCMAKVEREIGALKGVHSVRANLTKRRVKVSWSPDKFEDDLVGAFKKIGFETKAIPPDLIQQKAVTTSLVPALAVSGCIAGNVMMMSVAVWAGAEQSTRQMLHIISGLLASISLAYAGSVFLASAWTALRRGRSNMDVPISVGLIATFLVSVLQTLFHAEQVYFDAVTGLIFFLLIGRTLDQSMRQKIGSAVDDLMELVDTHYSVEMPDGRVETVKTSDIKAGALVILKPRSRAPVDGIVRSGMSDIDMSLVSGESIPRDVKSGERMSAGTLNLTSNLKLEATGTAQNSLLADMANLISEAETGAHRYQRVTDKIVRYYSPLVHGAAFATFVFWLIAGSNAYSAMLIAVSVLIITCPCALALAVPMVQVVAARRLLKAGVLLKDAAALERLAEVDHIVFDKTGTLTQGTPVLSNTGEIAPCHLGIAARLAGASAHPYAQALRVAGVDLYTDDISFLSVTEIAGCGIEAVTTDGVRYRVGKRDWATEAPVDIGATGGQQGWTVLTKNDEILADFTFLDRMRKHTRDVTARLRSSGYPLQILSGDGHGAVAPIATELGIAAYSAGLKPEDKHAQIKALSSQGLNVLMVGDGINDAPALAAASVSMAPSSGADLGRNVAGFILLEPTLSGVADAIDIAKTARRRIRQNLAISVAYNAVTIPLAMAGLVTPLLAAIAMSSSSLLVTLNALRGTRQKSPSADAAAQDQAALVPSI